MSALRWIGWTLALGIGLPAQEIWHADDVLNQIRHGVRDLRLGDVDHDGWDDVIDYGGNGLNQAPGTYLQELHIISGRDGTLLSALPSPQIVDPSGVVIGNRSFVIESLAAVGDMDGDGVPDYAISGNDYPGVQPLERTLEVRSGADHHLIWSATIPNANAVTYGWTIAGMLDLNGDGRPDLVTSAPYLSPGGTLIAYDNSGTEFYRVSNTDLNFLVGVDLAPLGGDLDGDGCDDFLTGSPTTQDRGAVIVVSGRTGAFLRVSVGTQPFDKLSEVTGCGDLDGDGVLDYAGGGMWGNPVVTTFSGATGLPIHTYRPTDINQAGFGFHINGGVDVDQDGVNDLVANSAFSSWGRTMSGRDGSFLKTYGSVWRFPGDESIGDMVLLPAPPGEQYPLLVYYVGTLQTQCSCIYRRLVATRLLPTGVTTFGAGDASNRPPQAIMGMRDLPGPLLRFTVAAAPPGAVVALAVGFSDTAIGSTALPLPLDPIGLPGITLLTSTDLAFPTTAGTTGVDTGYAALDFYATLAASGVPIFAQWLWLNPADGSHGSTAAHRFRLP